LLVVRITTSIDDDGFGLDLSLLTILLDEDPLNSVVVLQNAFNSGGKLEYYAHPFGPDGERFDQRRAMALHNVIGQGRLRHIDGDIADGNSVLHLQPFNGFS
jgi:hypothetical protein